MAKVFKVVHWKGNPAQRFQPMLFGHTDTIYFKSKPS